MVTVVEQSEISTLIKVKLVLVYDLSELIGSILDLSTVVLIFVFFAFNPIKDLPHNGGLTLFARVVSIGHFNKLIHFIFA